MFRYWHGLFDIFIIEIMRMGVHIKWCEGPEWFNELGSWITSQLIQTYQQYGVGSCPDL